MNQILFFEEKGIGSKMSNTVKFFSVCIAIFGMILIGEGGYSLAKSRNEKSQIIDTIQEAEEIIPIIEFEQENNKLNIKIEGKSEISKVTYKWNNEDEKELLNISGQKNIERQIDMPIGKNELVVKVIYKNAENFPYEKSETFVVNSAKIDFDLKGTNIKITVEEPKGIEQVSYRWNDGEEQIKKPDNSDNTKIEVLAEIPYGLNTLKATVINMFGEQSEATLDVKGAEKPTIYANLSEEGNLLLEVSCSDNIEDVEFTINGEKYILNILDFINQGYTIEQINSTEGLNLEVDENGNITNLKYEFKLQEDKIDIEIMAKSKYATETISGTLEK